MRQLGREGEARPCYSKTRTERAHPGPQPTLWPHRKPHSIPAHGDGGGTSTGSQPELADSVSFKMGIYEIPYCPKAEPLWNLESHPETPELIREDTV